MVAAPAPFTHENTIYVLSQLPVEVCQVVLQNLGEVKGSLVNGDHLIWSIDNRYYQARVSLKWMHELRDLKDRVSAGVAAVVIIVDRGDSIDTSLLNNLNTDNIDIPIVLGVSHASQSPFSAEQQSDKCIDTGWEYIDLEATADDDTGGQSGLDRFQEALQAHVWPSGQMKAKSTRRFVDDDELSGSEQDTTAAHPSNSVSPALEAFEDDFAPFVAFSNGKHGGKSGTRQFSGDDEFDVDDEDESATQLATMFAQLAGLRDQAMAMPNDDKRKEFAAQVAIRFAKHLDGTLSDEDELPFQAPSS